MENALLTLEILQYELYLIGSNISIYFLKKKGHLIYHNYNAEEKNVREQKDKIDILYLNENHFNLLMPNNEKKKE